MDKFLEKNKIRLNQKEVENMYRLIAGNEIGQ